MNGQSESNASYDGIIIQVGKEVNLGESQFQLHDNNNDSSNEAIKIT